MELLIRSNNPVFLSFLTALLRDADVEHVVLDENISIMEGQIGIFPRRVMVDRADLARAQDILAMAEQEDRSGGLDSNDA